MNGAISSHGNDSVKREELLVSLRNGRVVIVTGTGVSLYSVGYPKQPHTDVAGWLGLLQNGLDFCKRHDLLGNDNSDVVDLQLKQASARHLIDAAQQINDWLDITVAYFGHWRFSLGISITFRAFQSSWPSWQPTRCLKTWVTAH